MRANEFTSIEDSKNRFVEMFRKFLPLCMKVLQLDSLPKMEFHAHIHDDKQPTFGRFINETGTLEVALANRHPNDILRTIAHELQHYKQGTEHRLRSDSGTTGSPIENEAHAMAGIVMRHFNKQYPEYLSDRPVIVEGIFFEFDESKKNLVIFDIDDTLMHTTAKIKVLDKEGRPVRTLTNQEFNNYKLQPGEQFDFGEFRDAEKFRRESQPIVPIMNRLKDVLANSPNAQAIMLTARADFDDKEKFLDTFKQHGIDMSRVHVHRAGNLPGDAIPAEKKAVWVRKYLNTGNYKGVWLYDDSQSNLAVFKNLKKEYPEVNFHAVYVGPKGQTSRVESQQVEAK